MKKLILKTLQSAVQGDVFSQKEFRKFYSVDASSYQIIPEIIVVPKNEKDVVNVINIARKFKTSVTVRGAGTGLVGSALNNGIILEMKNFDSIRLAKDYVTIYKFNCRRFSFIDFNTVFYCIFNCFIFYHKKNSFSWGVFNF